MDEGKFDVVEAGVLTASAAQWERARSRFCRTDGACASILDRYRSGVEDAAQQLGVSQRQVYELLSRLRNGGGRSPIY